MSKHIFNITSVFVSKRSTLQGNIQHTYGIIGMYRRRVEKLYVERIQQLLKVNLISNASCLHIAHS